MSELQNLYPAAGGMLNVVVKFNYHIGSNKLLNLNNIGMKIAVIETGGKQYKVAAGQKLKIEKIAGEPGGEISFDKVLLRAEGADAEVGAPYLQGAKVTAKVVRQDRTGKKIVFRYHSKTRYRKFKTHRQEFTEVEITHI